MVWKDCASCLCRFSKSDLNGGNNTNIVLLQNKVTMSLIMISVDWLLALQGGVGILASSPPKAGRDGTRAGEVRSHPPDSQLESSSHASWRLCSALGSL